MKLSPDGDNQTANITFERESAVATAILLQDAQLGSNKVSVKAVKEPENKSAATEPSSGAQNEEEGELRQEDKPKSAIIAEYLSYGYVLSDATIEKAIKLDKEHGISERFISILEKARTNMKEFDAKYNVSERAQEAAQGVDDKLKVSEKMQKGASYLNTFFEDAIGSTSGQKIRQFYELGAKQVLEVHHEARRLADLRKPAQQDATPPPSDKADTNTNTE